MPSPSHFTLPHFGPAPLMGALLLLLGAACSPTEPPVPEVPECPRGSLTQAGDCSLPCASSAECDPGFACVAGTCAVDACSAGPCFDEVECTSTFPGFECAACPAGYSGDGIDCLDVDECTANPCSPNAECTNDPGSFRCDCHSGFLGDGQTCEEKVACQPGEFVSSPGTDTADPVCSPCADETYSALENAPECLPVTHCTPGTREVNTPSPASNRTCEPCPAGTFTTGSDTRTCTPHTECEPGAQVSSLGTARTDRTCAPCAEGTFSLASNAAACTPFSQCSPGSFVTGTGTATENRGCQPCAAGTYSSTMNANECKPHHNCQAGRYILRNASSVQDRQCGPCGFGTFASLPNQSSCLPHTTCEPGQSIKHPGTAQKDEVCAPCAAGTFSTAPNTAACALWQTCDEGYEESTPGTSSTDRTCADVNECEANLLTCHASATCENSPGSASCLCDDGFFGNGVSACYAVANCPAGEFIAAAPTPTTDRLCQECPEGYYNDDVNAPSCQRDCTDDVDCGPESYGCSADGRCVAVELCPNNPNSSEFNLECTFTNAAGSDETGRCVYQNETDAYCRRQCTPETSGECTTDNTVCQKSAPWTLNQKPAAPDAAPIEAPTQGHCAAPCESMEGCIGGAYGCDTDAGTCTWPRQSSCEDKEVGASCYITEIGSSGICAHAIWYPYASSITDPSGLYCSRTCGPNEAGAQGDESLCGGYRAQCGTSQNDSGGDKVYNLCAPSCAQAGPTLPIALSLLSLLILRRRSRRQSVRA